MVSRGPKDEVPKAEVTATFKSLQTVPSNKICADCRAKNPTWASSFFGIYLCYDCAGIHRSLGVHITFVRSITMDKWKAGELESMKAGGNSALNSYLAARGIPATTPHSSKYDNAHAVGYKAHLRRVAYAALNKGGRPAVAPVGVAPLTNSLESMSMAASQNNATGSGLGLNLGGRLGVVGVSSVGVSSPTTPSSATVSSPSPIPSTAPVPVAVPTLTAAPVPVVGVGGGSSRRAGGRRRGRLGATRRGGGATSAPPTTQAPVSAPAPISVAHTAVASPVLSQAPLATIDVVSTPVAAPVAPIAAPAGGDDWGAWGGEPVAKTATQGAVGGVTPSPVAVGGTEDFWNPQAHAAPAGSLRLALGGGLGLAAPAESSGPSMAFLGGAAPKPYSSGPSSPGPVVSQVSKHHVGGSIGGKLCEPGVPGGFGGGDSSSSAGHHGKTTSHHSHHSGHHSGSFSSTFAHHTGHAPNAPHGVASPAPAVAAGGPRLSSFQGQRSISSADYYDRDESGMGPSVGGSMAGHAARVFLGDVGSALSSMATKVTSAIQNFDDNYSRSLHSQGQQASGAPQGQFGRR